MVEQAGALDLEAIERRVAGRRLWLVGASTPVCIAVDLADWEALLAEVARLRGIVRRADEQTTDLVHVYGQLTERDGEIVELQNEVARLRAALVEDNEAATSRIWVAEQERDEAQAEVSRLLAALEAARHALATLNGVDVVDMGAYGRAQELGADANGAWDALCESGWTIDESKTLALLDSVLPPASQIAEAAVSAKQG